MTGADLLYSIFEQHLFNALVEDETNDGFVARVVSEYLTRMAKNAVIPKEHFESIESDLRDEVLEMLRKKTYGHFNVAAFRRAYATLEASPQAPIAPAKTRRDRRAC